MHAKWLSQKGICFGGRSQESKVPMTPVLCLPHIAVESYWSLSHIVVIIDCVSCSVEICKNIPNLIILESFGGNFNTTTIGPHQHKNDCWCFQGIINPKIPAIQLPFRGLHGPNRLAEHGRLNFFSRHMFCQARLRNLQFCSLSLESGVELISCGCMPPKIKNVIKKVAPTFSHTPKNNSDMLLDGQWGEIIGIMWMFPALFDFWVGYRICNFFEHHHFLMLSLDKIIRITTQAFIDKFFPSCGSDKSICCTHVQSSGIHLFT